MNNNLELKLSSLENLYLKNKDFYAKKYEFFWDDSPEAWNGKSPGALRINDSIPEIIKRIERQDLSSEAIILDICCGSPNLLNKIKSKFPKYTTYGIDIFTTEYNDFEENCSNGVRVFKFPFQMLFEKNYKNNLDFDLVMMYNSYRALDKVSIEGQKIKNKTKIWIENNSKNNFLEADLLKYTT
tara:strand:+ start:1986 stop:2537 length:552 start_codon:yes stop_codon:yes gene_type:complete